mmetsp:Transcript_29069/g.68131  ORF Transcript_29069/g.68131 Transcript_29069/m.68131 type:complete len:686 (-) Transcript_29069:119-2176(-)
MVETGGTIAGEVLHIKSAKMTMLQEIVTTIWPAVTEADPGDPLKRPFTADAIIANPVAFGHVHVAEALNIPLHIMFPQPWVGTHAFPHPMSGLSNSAPPSELNMQSYAAVDNSMWIGNAVMINTWRRKELHLPTLRFGSVGGAVLSQFKVPFSFMWSPAFVPKPQEWPAQCEVVGVFHPPASNSGPGTFDPKPFAELSAWLRKGSPPVFIGFGSMVITDTARLSTMIIQAAKTSGIRVLVQSNWSKLETASLSGGQCFDIGPAPHDWLLPQVSAVVHHGGAGTVAAGLRVAKPTLVCPFFGDQFFWGEMVQRSGCGPAPCPIGKLTAQMLAEKFMVLAASETQKKARELATLMEGEDGVVGAVLHFERWLPRQNLLCDVSLLLDQPVSRIARFDFSDWLGNPFLKVSAEVMAIVRDTQFAALISKDDSAMAASALRFTCKNWGLVRVTGFFTGLFQGLYGICYEMLMIIYDFGVNIYTFTRAHGFFGFLYACTVMLLLACCKRTYRGIIVLFDCWCTGTYNQYIELVYRENAQYLQVPYIFDTANSTRHLRRVPHKATEAELAAVKGVSRMHAAAVLDALALARTARIYFNQSAMRGNRVHVSGSRNIVQFASRLESRGWFGKLSEAEAKLGLSYKGTTQLAAELRRLGDFCSFTMFCIILQRVRAEDRYGGAAPGLAPMEIESV